MSGQRKFVPDGETLRAFMADPAPVKLIQGPIGSGKSLACAMSVWMKALEQKVQRDGKRRGRAHVFRETYGKLEETTVKTWCDWFPPSEFGRFYWSKPFVHEIRIGNIEFDVHFVALEDARQVGFFRSLETTMCWFNEVQYTEKVLFDEAVSRVGRYPREIDGGAVNPIVIADMNAPDESHWVPIMRGDVAVPDWFTEDQRAAHRKPENWKFFVQPPGLIEDRGADGEVSGYRVNPLAENLKYLPKIGGQPYYLNAIAGKSKSWTDANVLNKVSPRRHGKPVFRDFNRMVHVPKDEIEPVQGLSIIVGLDFARRPAAIMMQNLRGVWYVIDEFLARDMGSDQFAPLLKNKLAQEYAGFKFAFWGDPSGDFEGGKANNDRTPFRIFAKYGMTVVPAPSILFKARLQAAEAVLNRMSGGRPALQVSPRCKTLVAALDGGYHYRRLRVSGEKYGEEPEKDEYSDPADAFMYGLLGGGEGRLLLTGSVERKPTVQTRKPHNPFKSGGRKVRGW